MTRHIELETLAEYAEGLLDDAQAGQVRAHVAGCARCGAGLDDLAHVRSLLAAEPAPAMPVEVAARLDAALAAVVAEDQPGQAPAATDAERVIADLRRARRLRQTLAAAAGIAVIVGGGALVARTAISPMAERAGGAPAQSPQKSRSSPPDSLSAVGAAFPVLSTEVNYTRGRLAGQVRSLLERSTQPPASTGGHVPATPEVQSCVAKVTERTKRSASMVQLVDRASYDGKLATVIVFTTSERGSADPGDDPRNPRSAGPGDDPRNPRYVDVIVAGPGCGKSTDDVLAQVRVRTRP